MEYRELGRTGWKISAISLGTWAMGSLWGEVDSGESLAALNRALDLGINFIDTADVYGSEPLVGQLRKQRCEPFYITTKMGMQVNPDARGYTRKNMSAFTESSLRQLNLETIDLMQLHCPPMAVYNAETFGILDELVKQGKIRHYGVSVERIDEAEAAIKFPGVQSVQLIFNIFRQRPIDDFFPQAKNRKVGIIARVPMAQMALRWILMFPEVTCAIPGAKHPSQAEDNIHAADLPPLSDSTMEKIRGIYDRHIRAEVQNQW